MFFLTGETIVLRMNSSALQGYFFLYSSIASKSGSSPSLGTWGISTPYLHRPIAFINVAHLLLDEFLLSEGEDPATTVAWHPVPVASEELADRGLQLLTNDVPEADVDSAHGDDGCALSTLIDGVPEDWFPKDSPDYGLRERLDAYSLSSIPLPEGVSADEGDTSLSGWDACPKEFVEAKWKAILLKNCIQKNREKRDNLKGSITF